MADDGRSETIIAVTAAFLAISLVTVCLRCFVRTRIVKAWGWDDTTMVLAMALNIGFAVCGIAGAKYGMGQRMLYFYFHIDDLSRALFCWWLGQLFYTVTCFVIKISIMISLLRITIDRRHRYVLYAAMSLTTIVGMLFFFFTIFQCKPVGYFWDRLTTEEHGKCLSTDTLIIIGYVYSAGAAAADFTIGLLPAFIIWNLRMNPRAKLAIAGILGIGCIASAAVIIRIPYLHLYKSTDFLYATTPISIWSNVEAGLGITAGSLTTLRPLVRFLRDSTSAGRSARTPGPGTYPLGSSPGAGGKGFLSTRSRGLDPDDARLWPGSADDPYTGVTTTVMGSRGPNADSSEDLNFKYSEDVKVERSFRVSVN